MVEAFLLLLFPATMAYAASSDLLTMKIPNQLTLGVAIAYVAIALLTKTPAPIIGLHLACGALVLAITFGMFCMGWMGGGDAKLAAATALWFGWSMVLEYLLLASVLGGALTLAILFARQFPLPASLVRHAWIARLHDRTTGIPYGIALAAAALILYPHSAMWTATLRNSF
jgi:prepilin peptidase CpaA